MIADRAEGIAYARRWREANRAYFDAIYGPELRRSKCPHCGGRTKLAVLGSVE